MTDFLQFVTNKTKMFVPIIPEIISLLEKTGTSTIIDLGSGGGGGLLSLNQELVKKRPDVKFVLTDLFPNFKAFQFNKSQATNFESVPESVDARDVPEKLNGLRTMFLAFHHFKPEDALQILQNAVNSNQPILIVEGQERNIPSFLAMFISPLTVWFTTPFIKPFSIERFIFTYPIPLVPIFTWWDGIVSVIRTYSVKEMKDLISKVKDKDRFHWKTERIKSGPGHLLYLSGSPKN